MGDALSFTHFSPEIVSASENESCGTLHTFSFGTNVRQMCAVRFAEKKGAKIVECGDEMAYPLIFPTVFAICAPSLCFATPQSTNIVVFSLFFFLVEPIVRHRDRHLPIFGSSVTIKVQ